MALNNTLSIAAQEGQGLHQQRRARHGYVCVQGLTEESECWQGACSVSPASTMGEVRPSTSYAPFMCLKLMSTHSHMYPVLASSGTWASAESQLRLAPRMQPSCP